MGRNQRKKINQKRKKRRIFRLFFVRCACQRAVNRGAGWRTANTRRQCDFTFSFLTRKQLCCDFTGGQSDPTLQKLSKQTLKFSPAFFKRRRVRKWPRPIAGLGRFRGQRPQTLGRSPTKKRGPQAARRLVQTQGLPSAEGVTDVARLARILQSPAFRKKRPVTAKLSRTCFFRCLPRCHRCRSDLPRATNAPRCARITSPSDTTCSPRRKTAFARPCTAIPSSGV